MPDIKDKTKTKKEHKISKKFAPQILVFTHRKLGKKARVYQHEINHLTFDLLEINRKIQKISSICKFVVDVYRNKKKGHQLSYQKDLEHFDEMLYHIENFIFRLYAYRDKIALFVNFALDIGFDEGENALAKRISKNKIAKNTHVDTELKKFSEQPFSKLLEKRTLMTHRAYYSNYNPHFYPEGVSPAKDGLRKAKNEWKRKIIKEVETIDKAFIKITEINTHLTEKVFNYLSK